MSDKTFERRYAHLEFRDEDDESGALVGYAAVFDEETELFENYFEVVRSSAFDRSIEHRFDTRALFNHDDNKVLGRVKSGTLRLKPDRHGLRVEIDAPKWADGIVESIRRGDIDQMSFGFVAVQAEETQRTDGTTLRELKEVKLFDVSPVTFPAYEGTEIQARRGLYVHEDQKTEIRGHLYKPQEDEIEDPSPAGHSIDRFKRRFSALQLAA